MNARALSLPSVRMVIVAAIFGAVAVTSYAEKYPSRPVDLIVNFGPGGGADQMGRTVAKIIAPLLNTSIPASNVAGAAGNAGLTKVANSKPDGYTIGTMTGLTVSSWAAGMGRLGVGDFAYIGIMQSSPSMFFVAKDSPYKTYQDLLNAAKANPNKIRVATAGYGTLDDIAVKYVSSLGFPMVNVPYAKPGERYVAPLGGHTEVLYEEPGDVLQFLESKQLRPLVIFGAKRHPAFPDVPASFEFDQKIDLPNWRGIVTSSKVPADRIAILHSAAAKAAASPEWKAFCEKTYSCNDVPNPEEGRKFVEQNFKDISDFMQKFGLKKKKG